MEKKRYHNMSDEKKQKLKEYQKKYQKKYQEVKKVSTKQFFNNNSVCAIYLAVYYEIHIFRQTDRNKSLIMHD